MRPAHTTSPDCARMYNRDSPSQHSLGDGVRTAERYGEERNGDEIGDEGEGERERKEEEEGGREWGSSGVERDGFGRGKRR